MDDVFSTPVYTVSSLNDEIKKKLELNYSEILVEGELSEPRLYPSGHFYFTLKDEEGQIAGVFFAYAIKRAGVAIRKLQHGDRVEVTAQLSLYVPQGKYQLIVKNITPAGLGDLEKAFRRLYSELELLGYFAAERKRRIDLTPRCVGIITSGNAAALNDALITLKRRNPLVEIRIYESLVQGEQAPEQLIRAIRYANLEARADTLLLIRGGGSLEDLWAFNDKNLAQAIVTSAIPIISGVGHERDFTIADYCADLRAATPTAAAECCCMDLAGLLYNLRMRREGLKNFMERAWAYRERELHILQQQLKHLKPLGALQIRMQKQREQQLQLKRAVNNVVYAQGSRLQGVLLRLRPHDPRQQWRMALAQLQRVRSDLQRIAPLLLAAHRTDLKTQEQKLRQLTAPITRTRQAPLQEVAQVLRRSMQQRLPLWNQTLEQQKESLKHLSPYRILQRGYAIVQNETQQGVHSYRDVQVNEALRIRLADGQVDCRVTAHQALEDVESV